jgi:hypothetical protein
VKVAVAGADEVAVEKKKKKVYCDMMAADAAGSARDVDVVMMTKKGS